MIMATHYHTSLDHQFEMVSRLIQTAQRSVPLALLVASIASSPALVLGFSTTANNPRSMRSNLALNSESRPSNSFNPFRMVGDMASGLLGGDSLQDQPTVDKAIVSMESAGSLQSWTTIRSTLESKMETDIERNFRANLKKGYGEGSPLHKIRLFDESNKEEDIRVTFYR